MGALPKAAVWSWQGLTDSAQVRHLLEQWEHAPQPPQQIEVWISEGPEARAALQAEVQARWPECTVQVWNCYKPLVSRLLDSWAAWQQHPPERLELRYPTVPHAHPERFLLEAYPLAAWARQWGCELITAPHSPAEPGYVLNVDGNTLDIPVPLREAAAVTGEPVQRMTGRLRVDGLTLDFPTAPEQLWEAYLGWLAEQAWPERPPYFGCLQPVAHFPFSRESLHHGHEALDLGEALSEELYFGTQEFFEQRQPGAPTQRTLQLGQVVPLVLSSDQVQLEVLNSGPALAASASHSPAAATPDLTALDRPLSPAEALAWQERLRPERAPRDLSVQGRPVVTFLQPSEQPGGLLVTAGQHANEATGVVAALRAVAELEGHPLLTVIPQENPDGYALFSWLQEAQHPEHMHHAARYTALGDDLEYRCDAPWYERAARRRALAQFAPQLHVNLHGYPSHEWTRPMNGYVPQGFEAWTLPKGFCLIFRAQPGQEELAEALADTVTADLAQWPELTAFNAAQCQVYEAHTSARPYRMIHGTPCLFAVRESLSCPLELVTEFPDETVTGADFRLGQQAQLEVIRSALRWVERHTFR
ncbi:peptidase M14 [Deinococcus piscis]|uniref:Peptidase M14 n=1 Tax=Deinococcus piscis TaxID=394230 RepID=A0ABQ3KAX8_9DEIO|nr:hypothetical protein [Deinococcus piscis]GHG05448.1 peptidase M14 [Deinococcus piscis]